MTATSTLLLDCAMCGRETTRLFDGDHCAVCRLCRVHRMIAEMVFGAVVYEGLDPEDVRETIEGALKYAETKRGTGHGRLSDVQRELDVHQDLVRSEVA